MIRPDCAGSLTYYTTDGGGLRAAAQLSDADKEAKVAGPGASGRTTWRADVTRDSGAVAATPCRANGNRSDGCGGALRGGLKTVSDALGVYVCGIMLRMRAEALTRWGGWGAPGAAPLRLRLTVRQG